VPRGFVIAIVGPTASGKSDLAFDLACRFGGEIVSCDSVQIYQELDIGSAKPPQEWRERIPHYCIDIYRPTERVSAGLYKPLAEEHIIDIWNRKKIPIVVGGTGLYFNALCYGLFEGPPADPYKRALYHQMPLQELLALAERIDPEWYQKNQTRDRRRLVRLLEVYDLTGEKLSTLQQKNKRLDVDWYIAALNWPRETLYHRINTRVIRMIEAGLIEETIHLRKKWGREAVALQSLGYKQVGEYLDGIYDKDTMIATIQQETRRYAKRQLTWFRKIPSLRWFAPEESERIGDEIEAWIASHPHEGTLTWTEGSPWP